MKRTASLILVLFLALSSGYGQNNGVIVKEWSIPFLNCLTGAIASIGEYLNWGAEQAAREINAAGGIAGKPVKIIPVDTALDAQKGAVEMARVVKSGLVALGPVPEPVIMAAMPIAVENKMMSMTATTSLEYAEQFFPWTVSWFGKTDTVLGNVAYAWAKQFKDLNQVVQFVEPYGPWPDLAGAHVKGLERAGVKVQKEITVPTDGVTFSTLVVKALDQNPDGIIFACNGEKVAKIIRDLKDRGWNKMDHLLIFWSADVPELYSTGGSVLNGVQIYNSIAPNINTQRWNKVAEAYAKDHKGEQIPSLATNYYDAVYMIKDAIEKTGVTGDPKKLKEERKKIADYCANVKNFNGLMFEWDMKDGIPVNKPAYILSIENGSKKLVKEVR